MGDADTQGLCASLPQMFLSYHLNDSDHKELTCCIYKKNLKYMYAISYIILHDCV